MMKGDYSRSISCHESSIALLQDIIDRIAEESLINHFNTLNSLTTLKSQIVKRIDQLKLVQKSKEYNQQREKTPVKEKELCEEPDNQMLIEHIKLLMVKDLNFDLSSNKVKFIEQDKINKLEHDLQLINFKEKSSKQQGIEELKVKNSVLTELNLVYYSELMANHEFIRDLLELLKNGPSQQSGDQYEQLKNVIDQLQQKIATQERDRIVLENQIIKLKERWNNLVESARKRKELELQQREA
ncbi:hypothetical protein KL942_001211 [Ogataea angusta]|uniref:Uncharacterized protein n=1 Tax=Pichia angusta TaxID=870730 RepID=A0ABQ7S1B9_PICAN|nr:hypothetical protein KL942_001211 [Ogataea angusta]KAG7851091.1 hypothetical protein KL940_001668 [Ogataea angusta]